MTDLRTAAEMALKALIEYEEHEEQEYGFNRKMAEIDALGGTPPAIVALRAALESPAEKTGGNLIHIKLNIMKTALENIAGIRPIVDNLMSDKDIARIALERIDRYEHSISKRPPP